MGNQSAGLFFGFQTFGLFIVIDTEEVTDDDHGKNDTDDAQRIRGRISRCDFGNFGQLTIELQLRKRLLGGTETRCIGYGTR